MTMRTKIALSAVLLAASVSGALAQGTGVPGERNPHAMYASGAPAAWYEGGRNMLQTGAPAQRGRSAYEGRAQLVAPQAEVQVHYGEPWGPRSASSLYGGGF